MGIFAITSFMFVKEMNFLVVLTLAVLAVALGAPVEEKEENRINGENGWYVPQINGSFEWMSMSEAAFVQREQEDMNRKRSSTVVNYYLFTQSNPTMPQKIEATIESIEMWSNFDKDHPTKFIIHGWGGSWGDEINVKIREAWLSKGQCNVIIVDWSSRAQTINYPSSVSYVPDVGKIVAEFVDFLNSNFGLSFDTLTIIGHSLGAHVAGYAGKNVKNGRVHTIIGLDPALPLFSYDKPKKRLSPNDAVYVESIQTNGGKLGFLMPIGKGAFYPNGGKSQPGCGLDLTGSCAHSRSYLYYAEAVSKNDFPSMKCPNYEDAVSKDCGATFSSVRMGATTNAYMASGDFYVPVKKKTPYGMGS